MFYDNSIIVIIILFVLNALMVFLFFYRDFTEGRKPKKSSGPEVISDNTYMVVHELRSPLTVIKGTSDMLVTEFDNFNKDQIKDFLTQMRESANSLLDLVTNILDEAKIQNGKYEILKSAIDINKLLKDEFDHYYELSKQKDIRFVFDVDESVEKIDIDAQKIKQVMNNLLSNSLKFTDKGGTIKVTSKFYGDYLEICVSDNGKGISPEIKEKLFNKFAQGRDSLKLREPGSGLGLAIAKSIVEAHGGKIWFEDNVPRGARFLFTIPIG